MAALPHHAKDGLNGGTNFSYQSEKGSGMLAPGSQLHLHCLVEMALSQALLAHLTLL
jgi:hypothetical protein